VRSIFCTAVIPALLHRYVQAPVRFEREGDAAVDLWFADIVTVLLLSDNGAR
jgi:hypothetical protein